MLTHNKRGYGFLNVYMRYTYTFLIHSLFWFVMHIIASQSAGVLHVPACKHDRPPLPGFTFLNMRWLLYNLITPVLIATPKPSERFVQVIYCNGELKDARSILALVHSSWCIYHFIPLRNRTVNFNYSQNSGAILTPDGFGWAISTTYMLMTVYCANLSFGEKNLDSKEVHLRLSVLNECVARI